MTGIRATPFPTARLSKSPMPPVRASVIDKKGYALTNKHVIEDVRKLMRADLLLEKSRDLLIKVEPRVWVFFDGKLAFAEVIETIENFVWRSSRSTKNSKVTLRLSSAGGTPEARVAALGFQVSIEWPCRTMSFINGSRTCRKERIHSRCLRESRFPVQPDGWDDK